MPGNSKKRGDARAAAKAARRAAVAKQYGLPAGALATSQPAFLGRAMFLSQAEAKKYKSSGGKIPEYLQPGYVKPPEPKKG